MQSFIINRQADQIDAHTHQMVQIDRLDIRVLIRVKKICRPEPADQFRPDAEVIIIVWIRGGVPSSDLGKLRLDQ